MVNSSSSRTRRRFRLAAEIDRCGIIQSAPCDFCHNRSRPCVKMPGKSLKCSECVRRGRSCVYFSWESLDVARDSLEAQLRNLEGELRQKFEEVQQLLLRLSQVRAGLEAARQRAEEKMVCLAQELEDDENDPSNPPLGIPASALRSLSSVPVPPSASCALGSDFDALFASLDQIPSAVISTSANG
jgi:hypothetical protein